MGAVGSMGAGGSAITYGSTPGGGYLATIPGAPGASYAGGAVGTEDLSWLSELARRRAEQKVRLGDFEYQQAKKAAGAGGMGAMGSGPDAYERGMRDLQTREAVAKTNAMVNPAPIRMSTIQGGFLSRADTPDENAMNAYQRQVFLPGSSTMTPTTSRMDISGLKLDEQSDRAIGADRTYTGGAGAGGMGQGAAGNLTTNGIGDYLTSLRMYQPDAFRALMTSQRG